MVESSRGDKIQKVEADIDCDVPISVAYDQFTQFEEFPRFMQSVQEVTQLDATHLHWVASILGSRQEWDAEIVEQEPDRLISWRSTSGPLNNGAVVFEVVSPGRCRVRLQMTYAPETFLEKAGSALGLLKTQVEADLHRFKRFVETREAPTGAWRGEIHDGKKGPAQSEVTPADALQQGPSATRDMRYGRGP